MYSKSFKNNNNNNYNNDNNNNNEAKVICSYKESKMENGKFVFLCSFSTIIPQLKFWITM